MLWRRREEPRAPGSLKSASTAGDAATTLMQEGPRAQASDTTHDSAASELGIEAQAELQRLRLKLGLCTAESAALPTVGRYRLEEELGQGGMGVVYRAHDPELDRTIAIKLVRARPLGGEHERLSARLLREAKTLGKLTHPNVVRIYDFGRHRGEVFLAMELVEGQPLRQWQTAEHREVEEILDAYLLAAEGLAAAHDEEIVHRDFKPDNVFVANDGRILVGDFGLAGALRNDEWPVSQEEPGPDEPPAPTLTRTGSVLGTLVYMAPEQLRGNETEPRSDQYAFCVSLWEAIAGQRPFAGEDRESLLSSLEHDEIRGTERLPRWLSPCLRRGLSEDPVERYGNIHELVEDIQRARPRPRRWSGLQMLVGASLSAAVVTLVVWNAIGSSTENETQTCDIEQRVVELRAEDSWVTLLQRLEAASASDGLRRLQDHTVRLQDTARELCEQANSVGIGARRQHLQLWLDDLRGLLDSADARPLSQILEDVDRLDRARLSAPPPREIDDAVVDALQTSESLERRGKLDEALDAAKRGVELANERPLELTVALIRYGRILALQGDHRDAIDAYRRATDEAESEAYAEARLQARLLSAKTALMRLEDLEQGERDLDKASALFDLVQEPSSSPRRADYEELLANLSMLRGNFEAAEAHQSQVVAKFRELGDRYETGLAHINLGVLYERRGSPMDLKQARQEYEEALELLGPPRSSPASRQAACDLGHWLAQYGEDDELDEARRLLLEVRDTSMDLRLAASHSLVIAALRVEDSTQIRSQADALELELETNTPASVSEALDAWMVLASAWAFLGETTKLEPLIPRVYELAKELENEGQPRDAVAERLVGFEMTIADQLSTSDPSRARTLATRAHERLLDHPNSELSNEIEAFLDELP